MPVERAEKGLHTFQPVQRQALNRAGHAPEFGPAEDPLRISQTFEQIPPDSRPSSLPSPVNRSTRKT